jgi:hypothetical protein
MAEGKMPVDFEKKVKQAASPNGLGSPVQISARDLMENYNYLLGLIQRFQDGKSINDMIYWDGGAWSILAGPSGSGTHVLGCVDGTLQWLETESC